MSYVVHAHEISKLILIIKYSPFNIWSTESMFWGKNKKNIEIPGKHYFYYKNGVKYGIHFHGHVIMMNGGKTISAWLRSFFSFLFFKQF